MNVLPLNIIKRQKIVNKTQKKDTLKKRSFIDLEKHLEKSVLAKCRISTKGKILFCNSDFIENSGYSQKEITNQNIDVISHPEMPKIIQMVIHNNLENNLPILSIVKHLSKDSRYYWTLSEYAPNTNENNLKTAYTIISKPITHQTKQKIAKLYDVLIKIEKNHDVVMASKYLIGFLEQKGMSYSEYIKSIL